MISCRWNALVRPVVQGFARDVLSEVLRQVTLVGEVVLQRPRVHEHGRGSWRSSATRRRANATYSGCSSMPT